MKRRGFLGFLAGGIAAGPSMVKTAAAQTMADLNLGGLGISAGMGGGMPIDAGLTYAGSGNNWAVEGLAQLLGRTAVEHARAKREVHVGGLDPDIAALRSASLSSKVRMQRDRVYSQQLESQKSYFERCIEEAVRF